MRQDPGRVDSTAQHSPQGPGSLQVLCHVGAGLIHKLEARWAQMSHPHMTTSGGNREIL